MASECIIHYDNVSETELCVCTDRTISKILKSASKWRTITVCTREQNIVSFLDNLDCKETFLRFLPNLDYIINSQFHRKCYNQFTDKTRIEAAIRKQAKIGGDAFQHGIRSKLPRRFSEVGSSHTTGCRMVPSTSSRSRQTTIHQIKNECIFCHSEKTYRNVHTRKRKYEPLTQCMTTKAEHNIKARANKLKDFDMIGLIVDQGLIAHEAKYHKSCYRSYLYAQRSCYRGRRVLYQESWQYFKTNVIEKKLCQEKSCITVQKLLEDFIKIVAEVEGVDASNYTSSSLKLRLSKSFPDITFHKQGSAQNKGELASMHADASQAYPIDYGTSSNSNTSTDAEQTPKKDCFMQHDTLLEELTHLLQ